MDDQRGKRQRTSLTALRDDAAADLEALIAGLRAERDAGLAREAALAARLAQRNTEFGERIEHQAATIEVLKAMSSSPGDAQPVFEQIAQRALQLCDGAAVRLVEFDGELEHLRVLARADGRETEADRAIRGQYPRIPDPASLDGEVILRNAMVHARDPSELLPALQGRYVGSVVGLPLRRGARVAGAIMLARAQ